MSELFSERHGLRTELKPTDKVNAEVYCMLLDCCEEYMNNLGYKYPEYCSDDTNNSLICGVDVNKLYTFLKYRIPNLFTSGTNILHPNEFDEFDQFALFDLIEFIAQNMKTIVQGYFHPFFQHYHLSFKNSSKDFDRFFIEINEIFSITGLQYRLTKDRIIERLTEIDYMISEVQEGSEAVPDIVLRNMLLESISLYKSSKPINHHLATEKIWDVLERLKTIYLGFTE